MHGEEFEGWDELEEYAEDEGDAQISSMVEIVKGTSAMCELLKNCKILTTVLGPFLTPVSPPSLTPVSGPFLTPVLGGMCSRHSL